MMKWQNIEDGVNCDLEYKHDKRVTSITGLDMGKIFNPFKTNGIFHKN